MTTLILPARYTPDSIKLWQAAIAEGWSVQRLQEWRVDRLSDDEPIAIYGESLFAAAIAEQLSLALLEPSFDWLCQLPYPYVKRQIRLVELKALREQRFPAFVKPVDGKCFPARVYESLNDFPTLDYLPATKRILISDPVTWEIEFRCFIRDRQCTTISVYEQNGELAQAPDGTWPAEEGELVEAWGFVQALMKDSRVSLPPAVAIDIGRIQGQGWAVVEANPAWGAGIYGCDPREVLHTIARGCCAYLVLTDEDRKWIIERTDTD